MRSTIVSWRSAKLPDDVALTQTLIAAAAIEAAAAVPQDSKATDEAKLFASGKSERQLAREAAEKEHDRSQRFKDHFERIALIAMYVIALGVLIAALIWFWHMIIPAQNFLGRWLNDAQVQALQNGLTGVVLVGLLADHFKKRLG